MKEFGFKGWTRSVSVREGFLRCGSVSTTKKNFNGMYLDVLYVQITIKKLFHNSNFVEVGRGFVCT